MCPEQSLEGRINVRSKEWIEDAVSHVASSSSWANDSQVARDFVELGFLHAHLSRVDLMEEYYDSPVDDWERPQGRYPGDDMLVCPNCANGSKYLFRERDMYPDEENKMQCLWCSHVGLKYEFTCDLREQMYWAQSGPHPQWHIVDDDERRTMCNRYNDRGLDTRFAPERDERPTHICTDCWHELIGWSE